MTTTVLSRYSLSAKEHWVVTRYPTMQQALDAVAAERMVLTLGWPRECLIVDYVSGKGVKCHWSTTVNCWVPTSLEMIQVSQA